MNTEKDKGWGVTTRVLKKGEISLAGTWQFKTQTTETNQMREITDHKVNGLNEALGIHVLDEPGPGGACHRYQIDVNPESPKPTYVVDIKFQEGPIKESGINGISNEALLAILIDRLKGFQSGQFSTKETAVALTHLETAVLWLHKRTRERMLRGVEGTNQK